MPRFIVGSGYTGTAGKLVSHEGWILVTDRTPLKSRWGGWYVTGQSTAAKSHLGNMLIRDFKDFDRLEELRVGNLDTLDALFDTKPYLTNKSDIVALLMLEHQVNAQNELTRVNYDVRTAIDRERGAAKASEGYDHGRAALSATVRKTIDDAVEPLVRDIVVRRRDDAHGCDQRRSAVRRAIHEPRRERSEGTVATRPRPKDAVVPLSVELCRLLGRVRRAAARGARSRVRPTRVDPGRERRRRSVRASSARRIARRFSRSSRRRNRSSPRCTIEGRRAAPSRIVAAPKRLCAPGRPPGPRGL